MNLRFIGLLAAVAAVATALGITINATLFNRTSVAKPDWTPQQKQAYLDNLSPTNAEPSFFRVVEEGSLEGGSTFMLLKFDGGDRVFVYKYPGFAPAMVALPPPSATTLP